MCNLYEYEITGQIIRDFEDHYGLNGMSFEQVMRGSNQPTEVYPKYLAPVMIVEDGRRRASVLRWGMPGPTFPPKPDEKPKRPDFITNVRNTESRHCRSWLQAAEVVVGKDENRGGRCIVPAIAFAEPDRNTSKPVINRWFGRRDGKPFFFAGIWREWTGDVGTIKEPNIGKHRLYSFLTTEPNGVVEPIHNKAMPVMLMTADDVEQWLTGTAEQALELQNPAPDTAVFVLPEKKKAA